MVQIAGSGIHIYDFEFIREVEVVVDFSADPREGEVPLTVLFTDLSVGEIYSWAWDFTGDGEVDSTEQNPSFVFTEEGVYTVTLTVNDGAGYITKQDFITVSAVHEDEEVITPLVTGLHGNFPNPFNPETTIRFSLSYGEGRGEGFNNVKIDIYNIRGQRVRTLLDGSREFGIGEHSVIWNGKDDDDNVLSSGVYFYRMRAGDYESVRRMLLMK